MRNVDEARTFMKVDDQDIFCSDSHCKKFWIDRKIVQKDGRMRSPLDVVYNRWVRCTPENTRKDATDELCKEGQPTSTNATRSYWKRLVVPFLRGEYKEHGPPPDMHTPQALALSLGSTHGGFPEGSIVRSKKGSVAVDHTVYMMLKQEMIRRYDQAAFKIYGDDQRSQKCPPNAPACRCSQRLALDAVDQPEPEHQEWPTWPRTTPFKAEWGACVGRIRARGIMCTRARVTRMEDSETKACLEFYDKCGMHLCEILNVVPFQAPPVETAASVAAAEAAELAAVVAGDPNPPSAMIRTHNREAGEEEDVTDQD